LARRGEKLLPFPRLFHLIEDGPENQGSEKGGSGIDFAFDGAVPERVAEGVGQGADNAGAHDGEELLTGRRIIRTRILLLYELTREVSNGPEQEEDGQPAGDGAHEVDASGGGMRIVAEQDNKKPAHEDKERGARRMRYLELIAAGYEFPAIPEATGGLHR